MGWWNVKARDLKFGDELRIPLVLDAELPMVRDVDTGGASGRVAVLLEWPSTPRETFWEDFDPNELLTVRR
jgi:hypothetical protein